MPYDPIPASAPRLIVQADTGGSLRETVNHVIDSVLATLTRFLELPVFAVLGVIAAVALVGWLLLWRLSRGGRRPRTSRALRIALAVLLACGVVFVFDHRVARLQEEVARLRSRNDGATAALLERMSRPGARRTAFLIDPDRARDVLAEHFPKLEIEPLIVDDAIDLVRAHLLDPPIEAFLAVVDLRSPRVRIAIGATLEHKTYTSDFARTNGCALAINGEAGNSPRPDCGFGPWIGHLMQHGTTLLREESGNPRPFLCFDAQNRAHLVASTNSDRSVPPSAREVIWGRVDAIVGGRVVTDAFRYNQPRTVMGVDADGARLFLLVVDGRQLKYSWGFTRAQVGWFLAAFDVHDAMLCDEGGSSCMYLRDFGGLVNVPSDDDGVERPTYTHFGIVLRD